MQVTQKQHRSCVASVSFCCIRDSQCGIALAVLAGQFQFNCGTKIKNHQEKSCQTQQQEENTKQQLKPGCYPMSMQRHTPMHWWQH
jgi:hypothetical protein